MNLQTGGERQLEASVLKEFEALKRDAHLPRIFKRGAGFKPANLVEDLRCTLVEYGAEGSVFVDSAVSRGSVSGGSTREGGRLGEERAASEVDRNRQDPFSSQRTWKVSERRDRA